MTLFEQYKDCTDLEVLEKLKKRSSVVHELIVK